LHAWRNGTHFDDNSKFVLQLAGCKHSRIAPNHLKMIAAIVDLTPTTGTDESAHPAPHARGM
jgi:hypothetical protein